MTRSPATPEKHYFLQKVPRRSAGETRELGTHFRSNFWVLVFVQMGSLVHHFLNEPIVILNEHRHFLNEPVGILNERVEMFGPPA